MRFQCDHAQALDNADFWVFKQHGTNALRMQPTRVREVLRWFFEVNARDL
jgi:hypothetical protein